MHHSTVDGMSGAALLSVLFDLEVDPGPEPEPPETVGDSHIPSSAELISEAVAARVFRPFELTRDILRTGQRLLNVRRVRNEPEHRAPQAKAALPLSAPRTSFNGTLTRRRQVALSAIGLADVKRLKNATGVTVNDVVLAVCTGALRRFLVEGGELPDKPLVAVVPVSVQPDVDAPYGSNKVSSMFVQLPAQIEDPLERLEAIHQGTKGAKEEHNALGADMLVNWAEHATPNTFAAAARLYSRMRLADRHRPVANLIISNVPGPDFPLYLAGAEMVAGFPLGPVIDGLGVNITIMSYRGTLYWGIISCPETMPKVWQLAADIPLALDELLEAERSRPGRVPLDVRPPTPSPPPTWAFLPTTREVLVHPDRRVPLGGAAGGQGRRARAHPDGPAEGLVDGVVGEDGPEAGHHEGPGGAGPGHDVGGVVGARRRPSRQAHRCQRVGEVGHRHGVDPVVGRVGHQELGAVGGEGQRGRVGDPEPVEAGRCGDRSRGHADGHHPTAVVGWALPPHVERRAVGRDDEPVR